jgi:2-C-methyl-D-erythritol 4-phosphate cytidylyltransferase
MAANDRLIVAAIVVAAGSGSRLGADVPKAFVEVGRRTLLEHAVGALRAHPRVGDCVVVVPADRVDQAAALTGLPTVAGGASRQDSVDAGLRALAAEPDLVLVHDAARAFVPVEVIERVLRALDDGADAAVPGLPVTDTIKQVDGRGRVVATIDRSALVAVQTPQGFRRAALAAAHARAAGLGATDDAALIEADHGRVVVVAGDERAFKITVPLDLAVAEVLARG